MKKVLIVDDDKSLLEIFKSLLSSMNYLVDIASTESEAISLFNNNYDKVFIDYHMYDKTTENLIKKVVAIYGENNVYIVTGVTDNKTIKILNKLGVSKTLKKPILATKFKEIID